MSVIDVSPTAIFRSELQARLLFEVMVQEPSGSAADLSRRVGAPLPSVLRELKRLTDAGYLEVQQESHVRRFIAAERNPATAPLRLLLLVVVGPTARLTDLFATVPGVKYAAIYGSWAARKDRIAGRSPGDIDLVVVGDVDRREVFDIIVDVENEIRREINPTFLSEERWLAATEPFIVEMKARPRVVIRASDDA